MEISSFLAIKIDSIFKGENNQPGCFKLITLGISYFCRDLIPRPLLSKKIKSKGGIIKKIRKDNKDESSIKSYP